jgi:hypothetical protein
MARSREDGSRQAVDGQLAAREDWRARLENTNINPETLLATDYLNHFNEVVMLLDLVAEMPDCRADLAEWRPCTYPEHFRQSGFAYSDLAIAAWEHVTPDRRQSSTSSPASWRTRPTPPRLRPHPKASTSFWKRRAASSTAPPPSRRLLPAVTRPRPRLRACGRTTSTTCSVDSRICLPA